MVKKKSLAQWRALGKLPKKKKAISLNFAKLVFGLGLPISLVILDKAGGRRSAVENLALAFSTKSTAPLANIPIAIKRSFMQNALAVVGLPVVVTILGRVLGRWAPRFSIPGVVSLKAF